MLKYFSFIVSSYDNVHKSDVVIFSQSSAKGSASPVIPVSYTQTFERPLTEQMISQLLNKPVELTLIDAIHKTPIGVASLPLDQFVINGDTKISGW